ncbi:MAG TPA: hypothetical protein VJZ27_01350, partial [Aggregatilineales bacterium]|nr:hypothetical protein [Aggregatilineales bacterium]
MIPRWFERVCVIGLLLLAVWLRTFELRTLPPGFSNRELRAIDITGQIRSGTVQVFFPLQPDGAEASFYHTASAAITALVGDGTLGYRLLGLWANLLALAFLYAATRALFGPGIGLVSLAIMVTGIWSVLLSRTVSPLSLVPLFVCSTLAIMTWTFRLYQPIAPTPPLTTRYTVLGFLIGGAIYTHYVGLLLALILLLFVVYLRRTNQPVSRRVWSSSLFALTLILVLSLPYIISVLRNPTITGIYLLWKDRPTGVIPFLESILKTFSGFAYSGDSSPTHNVPNLPLLWPIWFLLTLVGFYFALRRWREPAYGMLLIMLVVGLLPDIWLDGGPSFPDMLLVQPILYILT